MKKPFVQSGGCRGFDKAVLTRRSLLKVGGAGLLGRHMPALSHAKGHAQPLDDIRLRDTNKLFPAYGSVVDLLAPARAGVPTFVSDPHVLRDGSLTPGQHASFLRKTHDPFFIGQDPNSADFRLPELS